MFKFGKLPSAVIAIVLTIALLFSVAAPTFAYTASVGSVAEDIDGKEIVGQDVDQGKQTEYSDGIAVGDSAITEDCDVYATVPDSDIVVTVPKVQILDGKSAAANVGVYTVAVRGDISAKTVITVEPQDEMDDRDGVNFEMSSAGKANIPTDVDQAKTMFTYADGVRPDTPATTTGTITAHGMTAGIWNGDFMFNISTGIAQPKDETTNYTAEEIDESEYLIPIGKTDPYYVVANFNEDYSEVVITKNGDNSDGLMMDWSLEDGSISPMTLNVSTLTSVKIENGVRSIGDFAFLGVDIDTETLGSNISEYDISNTVTSVGNYAFGYNTSLKDIYLSNVETVGDAAFGVCSALESVTFSNNIKTIGTGAFTECASLSKINFPDGLNSIGQGAFNGCISLTSVEFPQTLTEIGDDAFSSCTALATVTLNNNYQTVQCERYLPFNGAGVGTSGWVDRDYVETVIFGDGVTAIGENSFNGCKSLKKVVLSNSVDSIDSYAFYYCTKLVSVDVGDGISLIGNSAFSHCLALEEIDLSTVKTFEGHCFYYCSSLTSVTLNCGLPTTYNFRECNNITEVTLLEDTGNIQSDNFYFMRRDTSENYLITIYGVPGTYAEQFASSYDCTFVAIS